MAIVKAQFNSVFKEFNNTKARYRLAVGSAGSGKSVDIAQDFILKLSDPYYKGANLLVVRQTETSHELSTFAELSAAVYKFGLKDYWDIRTRPLSMKCLITGNEIAFKGFADERARERVKSISFAEGKLVWIWIEEACEIQKSDVNILDDRLRGQLPDNLYYQITMSTNPVNPTSWLKTDYWDWNSDKVFKCHSTYLDNRFCDEAYHERMLRRKEVDPEGYRVYGLGEWGELEGLILKNYCIEDINTDFNNYDSVHYAQDFGFNHANCILELGFKDDEIYVLREIYVHEKDTSEIIDMANNAKLNRNKIMYCDSAEPDRIKMWRKAGYHAVPVEKEPNSVKAQIDYLKQHKIHINGSCINTIKEIQAWKWKKDKTSGKYIDEPVDIFDDAMAALRYGVEPYRKVKKLASVNKSVLGL